jgi:hypothetical protein
MGKGKGSVDMAALGGDDLFAMMGMKRFSIMEKEDKVKAEEQARRAAPAAVAVVCQAASATCVRVKLDIRPRK